jgi:predicted amidohydrolase
MGGSKDLKKCYQNTHFFYSKEPGSYMWYTSHMTKLTLACIQINAGTDKSHNLTRVGQYIEQAVSMGATHVFLPEVFNYRGPKDTLMANAETLTGPSIQYVQSQAIRYKVWIHAGSFCEKVPNSSKLYNTTVVISPTGKISAKYQKMNLFDATVGTTSIRESDHFNAGTRPKVAQMGDLSVGLTICYDLRFSDIFAKYKAKHVHAIAVPASFTTPTGKAHWEILLRARAIETHAYIIAPNQSGVGAGGVPTYGNSMVIDPWGTIIARASETHEGPLIAKIDLEKAEEIRNLFHRNRPQ